MNEKHDGSAWSKAWSDVQSLRPIIEAHREEAERSRRLPDAIGQAFLERDVYRLCLPTDMGGADLTPLQQFDLIVEVARWDSSAAWVFWLGSGAHIIAGRASAELTAEVFAGPDCAQAAALAPTGRAVAVDGGYRVTGRWAWASGIHLFPFVSAHCLVFDGDKPRQTPQGAPSIMMVLVRKNEVSLLDTWHTGGMRGTGSTEFEMADHFVPSSHAFSLFGEQTLPNPVFRLPAGFFAYGMSAAAIGLAYATIEALKELALAKKLPPSGTLLAEKPSVQYTVAKALAMVEAVEAGLRGAISRACDDVCGDGVFQIENRLRFRRALTHAVDTCIEAVSLCYREAGGSAVHQSAPFERAVRDIHTIGGHMAVQRGTLETAGGVAMGVAAMTPMF